MEEDLLSRRRSNYTFVILITLCVFFLTAHLSGYIRGLKNFAFYVLSPTPQAAARIVQSGQEVSQNLKDIVRIHQENQELRALVEKYGALDAEIQRTKEENERLHHLTNLSLPVKERSVAAHVTAREPGTWFQWVMIDKGSQEGIFIDAPVLAWSDDRLAILGRVNEVYPHSAKIVLITSVISAVPVEIKSLSEDGLLEGQNNGRLRVNYLPADSKAAVGAEVVTSPLSAVFPPGLRVGYVRELMTTDNEAFRSASIASAVNLSGLREVIVLIPVP